MVSRDAFAATDHQRQTQVQIQELDELLPSDAFTPDVRRALYQYALIRNSWGTTNIDAGPIDLARVAELYEAYTRGTAPGNKVLPTEREVINYFQLIGELPKEHFRVSTEDVRLLHHDYFRDVPLQNGAKPGRWKDRDNKVFTPWGVLDTTTKENAEGELHDLLEWYNDSVDQLPLVARVGIFFHGFQRIHPFGDGNGRAGRLTALFLLSSGGLDAITLCPIDDAINEDREEYYLALRRGDEGDLEYWVNYFGAQVRSGYQRAHLLAQRLQHIPPRVPETSRRLLEWVYVHKIASFKLSDVRDFYLKESQRTVIRRLQELADLGSIQREGSGAGSKYTVRSLHDARQLR